MWKIVKYVYAHCNVAQVSAWVRSDAQNHLSYVLALQMRVPPSLQVNLGLCFALKADFAVIETDSQGSAFLLH